MKLKIIAVSVAAALIVPTALAQNAERSSAEELQQLLNQIEQLKQRVLDLEQRVAQEQTASESANQEQEEAFAPRREVKNSALAARVERLEEDLENAENDPIRIGGAVRTQYVWEDYNDPIKDRGGDFDFDLIRIDYSGEIGDVVLSAQYRWFQYMDVVQHAWVGYNFTDNWQGQLGVTKVPFGNTPYNSNSYFFSSNFYVGLEDDHDMGAKMRYRDADWDFDIAFFKSDELGGADGLATNKSDRYAYDAVGLRVAGEGIYDDPAALAAETNSWALRGVRKWTLDELSSAEFGASLQWGDMNDGIDNVGERSAWALHGLYNYDRWTFMGQVSQYDYDMDVPDIGIVVGAYNYFDTIPSKATLYTANIAYSMPVKWGPVTNLTFYNDFSLMTDKRLYTEDTIMNVLGFAVAAGGLYTYFDLVTARNQPFVGGSMSGDAKDTNTRFNINIGYYF
ncbi:carbohydrate porin [Pseudidiomarina sp.]|uniref:carbohydrate porin n=1 Tax=Pseudidiomarina sp. TaxID=2081707 RepID=UPI003A968F0D